MPVCGSILITAIFTRQSLYDNKILFGAFQAHGSYTILPNFWAAVDATYYTGGNVTVNGKSKDNRLSNLRWGLTVAVPSGKHSAFKLSYSSGAYVVTGTNFNTLALAWSHSWF